MLRFIRQVYLFDLAKLCADSCNYYVTEHTAVEITNSWC